MLGIVKQFATWLESTPLAQFMAESDWLFSSAEAVHVLAITLVFGTIAIVDLRLLGYGSTDRHPNEVIRAMLPLTWVAFALALLSGLLLFTAKPVSYLQNFYFLGKLSLIGLAGLNMLLFHFVVQPKAIQADRLAVSIAGRLSGLASLVIWIAAVAFGRWIGFSK